MKAGKSDSWQDNKADIVLRWSRLRMGVGRFDMEQAQRVKDRPRVCAVVLNWNKPEVTIECLDALYRFVDRGELAVVVVDNASTDDSVDRIRRWGASHFQLIADSQEPSRDHWRTNVEWDFVLLKSSKNGGYAAGNNLGLKYVMEERPEVEYIWVLNNDTVVSSHSLRNLLTCADEYPDVDIVGSTIVRYEHPNVVECAGGSRYWPSASCIHHVFGGKNVDEVLRQPEEVWLDYVSGAAMFCRAEMFAHVGWLDERFFLYYEELDLARRVRARNRGLKWCKKSIILHRGKESGEGNSRENLWKRNYNENVSTLLYTKKHHPCLLPTVLAIRLGGKIIGSVRHRRLMILRAFLLACRDTLLLAPDAGMRIQEEQMVQVLAQGVVAERGARELIDDDTRIPG